MGGDFSIFLFFFFWRWILPSTQVERATRILFVLRTSADNAAASVTLIVRPIASARFVSCKFHGLPAALARKWGGGSPLFRVGRAQRPVSLARKPREINLIRYRLLTISSTGNEFRKICSYFFFFSFCSNQIAKIIEHVNKLFASYLFTTPLYVNRSFAAKSRF